MLRLSFLPLKNNSVIVGVNFLIDLIYPVISSNTIDTFLLLDYSLLSFYKYHQLFATCSALLYFFGTFCRRNIFQLSIYFIQRIAELILERLPLFGNGWSSVGHKELSPSLIFFFFFF